MTDGRSLITMPNDTIMKYGIQLSVRDYPTWAQYKKISELIYETDPYIYPALFGAGKAGREAASEILPMTFESGRDTMFHKNNLFLYMENERVLGIILWHKGRLSWSSDVIARIAQYSEIELNNENIMAVRDDYVNAEYAATAADMISLINICVDSSRRGQGIGRQMMEDFIGSHTGERMSLCVLADNGGAVKLYKSMGFNIVSESSGFSLTSDKPKCYEMTR